MWSGVDFGVEVVGEGVVEKSDDDVGFFVDGDGGGCVGLGGGLVCCVCVTGEPCGAEEQAREGGGGFACGPGDVGGCGGAPGDGGAVAPG